MPLSQPTLQAHACRLRALHVAGRPLVLPNAWDTVSARAVLAQGFEVVATASAAIAPRLGYEDGGHSPAADVFAALRKITRAVDAPVTADLETSYGLEADQLVDEMLEAGVVGCNLEDSTSDGLLAIEVAAAQVAAVKDASQRRGVDVMLNARIDVGKPVWGLSKADIADQTIARAQAYAAAGADCVFAFMADDACLAAVVQAVDVPVNAITRLSKPRLRELADLGVSRISFGPQLSMVADAAVSHALEGVRSELRVAGLGADE